MNTAENGTQNAFDRVNIIDPLFAIAIAFGVNNFLAKDPIVVNWKIPNWGELVDLLGFLVVLVFVVQSWVSYRSSIRREPIESPIRLAISVSIVLLYSLLFAKVASVNSVLLIFATIFAFYTFWDYQRFNESFGKSSCDRESNEDRTLWRSLHVSLIWFAVTVVWFFLDYYLVETSVQPLVGDTQRSFATVLIILVTSLGYRWHKRRSLAKSQSRNGII